MRYPFRKRRKAPRRKPRFQVEGWTAAELAAKVGVSARTVRFYTAEGVLPAPEFRGAATRYSRQHLVRLAAIRWLQRERRMSLPGIRDYFRKLSTAELERIAGQFLPELAAAVTPEPPSPVAAPLLVASDTWQRLSVVPGLEVHWHATARSDVQAMARRLVDGIRSGLVDGECLRQTAVLPKLAKTWSRSLDAAGFAPRLLP